MALFKRVFCLLSFVYFLCPNTSFGQHYIFIEADGQQPFYVKSVDTLYSSTATGFLIIPKVPKGDMSLMIGFPKAMYPEATFNIKEVSSDRGFQLKLFDDKGWGLFDRTSMEVIYSNAGLRERDTNDDTRKNASPFASLLSDAIGDDVSLEQKPSAKKPEVKSEDFEQPQPKEQSNATPDKTTVNSPELLKVEDLESDKEKIITFIDKWSSSKTDTVIVKIDKIIPSPQEKTEQTTGLIETPITKEETSLSVQQKTKNEATEERVTSLVAQSAVARKLGDCIKPNAETKDMLNLQKKLLGMSKEEDQLIYIEKVFAMKCFTSKQAVEISSFFLDEGSKINFFSKVYWLVKDHDEFQQAGSLFFRDENIKAFKQLQSGN